jgi:hypothetical protein
MADSRDECRIADRVRNRGNQYGGAGGKRRTLACGRDMAGALRGNEAKRTLRCWRWLVLVAALRIGGLTGSRAAKDKAGLIRRRGCRHTKPDARHHRLDGERISHADGQKAAFRSRPKESPQASHRTRR